MKKISFKISCLLLCVALSCFACIDKADPSTEDLYTDTETTEDDGTSEDDTGATSATVVLETKTIEIVQTIEGVAITRSFQL